MTPASLRPIAELAARKPHGNYVKFLGGCRCLRCRVGYASYRTQRRRAIRAGLGNGLTDAAAPRARILELGRQGLGYRKIASLAQISHKNIRNIRSGIRQQIRRETERRILAVKHPRSVCENAQVEERHQ